MSFFCELCNRKFKFEDQLKSHRCISIWSSFTRNGEMFSCNRCLKSWIYNKRTVKTIMAGHNRFKHTLDRDVGVFVSTEAHEWSKTVEHQLHTGSCSICQEPINCETGFFVAKMWSWRLLGMPYENHGNKGNFQQGQNSINSW